MKPVFTARKFKEIDKNKLGKGLVRALAFLVGFFLLGVIGVFAFFAKDLPDPSKINKRLVVESSKIYDRTGQHLLYEIHGEEKRTLIPFQEIPDNIKCATIVLEDQDFYSHHGIKLSSIFRAAIKDFLNRGVAQGGSTITQQFIKNSILTSEKTYTRKIKEVILAIEMEQKFSKDEILGMYLNEIPYGSNAYGIEAASQTFFGKHARDLSLDEAAMLAALPKAPTYYSPYGSHLEKLKMRQEAVLKRMSDLGYISREQAEEAIKSDVFSKLASHREEIKAPHFVMYVKEYLEEKYDNQEIEQGGFNVYTTLDWDKQQIAERAVQEGAKKNEEKYNASNAALVAVDPKTGQILAMVGSKDYFDKSIDGQVNVAIRDRQPGSSFKPYVYLTAFSEGYTPETILFDVETEFETGTDKEYKPQNYDGTFHGPLKIKEALGQSLNIPAVKTLYLAGVKDSIKMAKRLGITGLNQPERYGLSLVLGGGEVKLLDHVSAFGTLANGGIRHEKTAILRVENSQGEILEEFKPSAGEETVKEKYVAMLDHIISTNKYRAPAFGENNPLRFDDRPVAAKTGTTNEFRDGWTIGYTPSLAVGVWAGNNDNTPMKEGSAGAYVAAPIWRDFISQVLGNYNIESFPEYKEEEDIEKPILKGELDIKKDVKVCEIPGKKDKYCLANKYCLSEDKKERSFANVHNILWYVEKDDPRGDYPEDPEDDPQFKKWEKGVKKWYEEEKDKYIWGELVEEECRQSDFNDYLPEINLSVAGGNTSRLVITVDSSAAYGVDRVKVYVDDKEVSSLGDKDFSVDYSISEEENNSVLKVKAKITDKNGNEASDSEEVNVSF